MHVPCHLYRTLQAISVAWPRHDACALPSLLYVGCSLPWRCRPTLAACPRRCLGLETGHKSPMLKWLDASDPATMHVRWKLKTPLLRGTVHVPCPVYCTLEVRSVTWSCQ
eukprot:168170-Prymnesium_polylepis.2